MNIKDLHPELHKVYGRIPAVPFHNPIFRRVANAVQKLRPNSIKPFPGVGIQEQPLKDGSVRIYQPQAGGSGAGLMWIHGGGYNLGDASINDRECSTIARELGLVVVSVNYRLAPKYPFPAALDDCQDAWAFMLSKADDWNIDRERIAILGQSAGGISACRPGSTGCRPMLCRPGAKTFQDCHQPGLV